MKKLNIKKIISASLALLLVSCAFSACSSAPAAPLESGVSLKGAPASFTTAIPFDGSEDHDGYEKIAETAALKLFFNFKEEAIEVHNKENGYIWSSLTNWEAHGQAAPNPRQSSMTGSLFGIVFCDIKANEGKTDRVYSKIEGHEKTVSKITGGIEITYKFDLLNMTIVLEIMLDDSGLRMRFPSDKIKEGTRNLLMALELLPGFGASTHNDTGYILFPDGSGGLLRYENYNNRPGNLTTKSMGVYGPYDAYITEYFARTGIIGNDYYPPYDASLPVYGVKLGGDAFLAYVTDGTALTKVNVSPEGYIVPFNRAAFEFQYRETFEIILSNITAGNSANIKKGQKVPKERTTQDFEAGFVFLTGDKANYSGMAQAYRDYLLKSGGLNKAAKPTADLSLSLFCGITEQQILMNKYIPMTTFSQAQDIVSDLLDKGASSLDVTLNGWAKNGYGDFVSMWPADGKLGGNKELESLLTWGRQNGISLFAQVDPQLAEEGKSSFSVRNDTIYAANGLPLVDDFWAELHLMQPYSAATRINELNRSMAPFEGLGLAFNGIGRYTYAHYGTDIKATREQTAEQWAGVLKRTKDTGIPLAVEYGNQYSLPYASRVYDVPTETSGTNISDEQVPFYQMVIHGSIPYTSNPGNLFYDEQLGKLKWIEFGCIPHFELTYERAGQLKFTMYNQLYTSYYADWTGAAAELYKEFNGKLAGTWDAYMLSHTRLSPTLVRIVYSSGKTVYINYGGNEETVDEITVAAMDYTVVPS